MLSSITTQHGRVIQYNLRLRKGNNRIVQNDLRKIDEWLHQEGILETEYMHNEYLNLMFSSMNPKKLTPCDRSMLNEYLFGVEEVMLHNYFGE